MTQEMKVGRITLGPVPTRQEDQGWHSVRGFRVVGNLDAHAYNCIGPQPGQSKCPCMLRGESEHGRKMVNEGVVIDGVEYELVRKS